MWNGSRYTADRSPHPLARLRRPIGSAVQRMQRIGVRAVLIVGFCVAVSMKKLMSCERARPPINALQRIPSGDAEQPTR